MREDHADASLSDVGLPVGGTDNVVLPSLISEVYHESAVPLRAKLLECLLRPLGPLALVAVAAGAFGSFLHRASWRQLTVSAEDALRIDASQVFELASYVEQNSPEIFRQVGELVANNAGSIETLSGSLLLLALRV